MSGTKEKTAGKQSTKGRAGKVSAQEMAQADAPDLPGAERTVTLSGHYVAVGSSPVSVTSGDAGITAASTFPSADWLNGVQGELSAVLEPAGHASADARTMSATDDVEVLEIRARSERGFWRCGRFWPREPVHVFVSDDPDGDNEANALEGDVVVECFISHETAERLKAEPHLVVTVLQTVAEKG